MHICVVSPSYPTSKTIDFVFVDQLCRAFADIGHKVSVIAPQSITKCLVRGVPFSKLHYTITTDKGNVLDVYRPPIITLGGGFLKNLIKDPASAAVKWAFNHLPDKPDVCYGHFWSSINQLFPLAKSNNIPLFGASGEEYVPMYATFSDERRKELSQYISGLVSVSSKNRNECLELGLVPEDKVRVIPNAINHKLFQGHDKQAIRESLCIKPSDFVVAFLGQFVPRKGTLRVDEALKQLNDKDIKAIFMGSGSEDPNYDGIIFKGRKQHDEVPAMLTACDAFVLPTENEGCCNAVIEAMACHLPIISTDAAFNHDILDKSNSIMIDCHNIDQIADAIKSLKNDATCRNEMSENAYKTAMGLSIDKRAEKIIEFIKSKI